MSIEAYSLAKDGAKQLSTNFKVREFKCNDGSDPIFIDSGLVALLQQVRSHFNKPVTICSAYRTPGYNAKVGAKYSQHLYGKAADIQVKDVKPQTVYNYLTTLLPNTGGLGIYPTFVHVDTRTLKSRWKG